ncbi:hypothetical protein SEPCBS57363_005880 [Sporothrix epigloea]|uniref:Uncharacterized protein n=1 Tax=Sporothrix epigloea TaxID=1892477 RepID=A0ABP0E007_9PEZI
MVAKGSLGQGYQLGSRVPSGLSSLGKAASQVVGRNVPSKVIEHESSSTTCNKDDANLCEKPEGGGSLTLPIVLGVVIPLVIIAGVLLYLHRRNVQRLRREDTMDPHKSLDFGMAMDATRHTTKTKRKSSFFGGEKDMFTSKSRQLSMDMNLSSPYLLPPELQNSRESLHSLARSLHQNEDPYRPVTQYASSDAGSMRSFKRDIRDGASIRTGASAFDDRSRTGSAMGSQMALRQNRLSNGPGSPLVRSPLPDSGFGNADNNAPGSIKTPPPPVQSTNGFVFTPTLSTPATPFEARSGGASPNEAVGDYVPAGAGSQATGYAVNENPREAQRVSIQPHEQMTSAANRRSKRGTVDEPFIYDTPNTGLRQASSTHADFDLRLNAPTERVKSPPLSLPKLTLGGPFDDETFLPGQATSSNDQILPHIDFSPEGEGIPPSLDGPQHFGELFPDEPGYEDNNTRQQALPRRQSSEHQQSSILGHSALGLPNMDFRRMSVGFRPLPPDELIESEDPETRANRIRSFYKEYFDDTKPDMTEYNQHFPPQGVPAEWRNAAATNNSTQYGNTGGHYYEDYDQSYRPSAGDANAYFDPQTNSFVMPYTQPVTRRAMTPPPSGSRFAGGRPRGGPRQYHGSMGGIGGPGGLMRPGSSMSNQFGPRPGSSLSSRQTAGLRKPAPPPEDLITLPTPGKLKDDSFSLLGAIDFAPPPTFRDQSSGRSQSPLGERRPYQMNVPVASPLVSTLDEMAALPSPHLLRKSSTFTGLDFAPPRKFKNADTMSDAGSIRSNRSGISALNQAAIRTGAGRVSRLPGDQVFTQAAMADQLKPTWGFRP